MLGRGLVLSGISLPSILPASTVSADSAATSSAISSVGSPADSTAEVSVEVQNISSTLTSSGYPDIVVQKDVPVVWNLKADAENINGCNRTMVISEYGIQVNLKEGDNLITFTPTKSGTFTYSCWMGMQTGRITVEDVPDEPSSQPSQSDLPDPTVPDDPTVPNNPTVPDSQTAPAATNASAEGPNSTAEGQLSCCANIT